MNVTFKKNGSLFAISVSAAPYIFFLVLTFLCCRVYAQKDSAKKSIIVYIGGQNLMDINTSILREQNGNTYKGVGNAGIAGGVVLGKFNKKNRVNCFGLSLGFKMVVDDSDNNLGTDCLETNFGLMAISQYIFPLTDKISLTPYFRYGVSYRNFRSNSSKPGYLGNGLSASAVFTPFSVRYALPTKKHYKNFIFFSFGEIGASVNTFYLKDNTQAATYNKVEVLAGASINRISVGLQRVF